MLGSRDVSQLSTVSSTLPELLAGNELREIGNQAVWTLSSCKPGYGVEQLRDDNTDTYWQSDGPQPHLVNIHFRRKTAISVVGVFADYKADESYTPSKISIRAGSHVNDLTEIKSIELSEPSGWKVINLGVQSPLPSFLKSVPKLSNDVDETLDTSEEPTTSTVESSEKSEKNVFGVDDIVDWNNFKENVSNFTPVKAFLLQVAILQNHQNGRDTHVRQIKVFSPIAEEPKPGFHDYSSKAMQGLVRFR